MYVGSIDNHEENIVLSALYYTVVVVYGHYTLGYNCHIPRTLLYPWIQAV